MQPLANEALTDRVYARLKEIETAAYEGTDYGALSEYEGFADMAEDYMDCTLGNVRVFLYPHAYLLIAEFEDTIDVVDFASDNRHTNIRAVIEDLKSFGKPFTAFCRETTSYKLLHVLADRNQIVLTSDETQEWDEEQFHLIRGMSADQYERLSEEEREIEL